MKNVTFIFIFFSLLFSCNKEEISSQKEKILALEDSLIKVNLERDALQKTIVIKNDSLQDLISEKYNDLIKKKKSIVL